MEVILPFLPYILFFLGLAIVIKGSDIFLDAVIYFARVFHISDVLIGFTLVSIGTTMPETVVSSAASISGMSDMALSNSLGSVACNLGFILGIGIILSAPKIEGRSILFKNTLLLLLLCLFYWLVLTFNGTISRFIGGLLLCLLILYFYMSIRYADKNVQNSNTPVVSRKLIAKNIIYFIVGLASIIFGASLIVTYGKEIAVILGVPPMVIGLTMAALGTSMPELFTMLAALYKKAGGVAIGNLIGASILNLLLVTPLSALIKPINMSSVPIWHTYHLPVIFLICLIVFLLAKFSKKRIPRVGGLLLLVTYISYITASVLFFNQ